MTKTVLAGALGLAGLMFALPAVAQTVARNCGPRAAVVAHLAEKYSETRQSIGLAANNMVMEVFASLDSGSWTITVTSPEGLTCLVASGQGFEPVTEELPARGSPA